MRLRSILLLACALAHTAFAADAPAAAVKGRPPIGDFFDNPTFSGALLSPSGKYLAVRIGAKEQRDRLAVITLGDSQVKVVGNFSDADIGYFEWVNDERLVFTATDRSVGLGDARYAPGMYAINRDGGQFRQLVSRSGRPFITVNSTGVRSHKLLPWNTYLLGQNNTQDSEYVYVVNPRRPGPGQIDYMDCSA